MKKILSPAYGVLMGLLLGAQAGFAATQEQSAVFTSNNEGQLITGTGTAPLVDPGLFTGTFVPFDATLGTLTSATVTFTATVDVSGTADPAAKTGGSLEVSFGGGFAVNGSTFNGTGGGFGPVTASAGDPLTGTLSLTGFTYSFLPEGAGVAYDPSIFGALTGSQAFSLGLNPSGNTLKYANAVDLGISANGVLKLTYEYVPATPAPVITGLIRQTGTGEVTLTWTSTTGTRYAVEASTDLSSWSEVASNVEAAAEGTETSWSETAAPSAEGKRFYRIRRTN